MIANLGFYLKQQHGPNVLKFFNASVQKLINDTKLDKDSTPISAEEVDLEESNKYFESLGFDITISIPESFSATPSVLNKVVLDTDSLTSFGTSKQSSLPDNLSTFGGSVSDASSYVFSQTDTDSHISAMSYDYLTVKSEISTLSKNLKSLAKSVGKMSRKMEDNSKETDRKMEQQQQDFLKSTIELQTMFCSLLQKHDNLSATDDEQVGVP